MSWDGGGALSKRSLCKFLLNTTLPYLKILSSKIKIDIFQENIFLFFGGLNSILWQQFWDIFTILKIFPIFFAPT